MLKIEDYNIITQKKNLKNVFIIACYFFVDLSISYDELYIEYLTIV